MKQPKVKVTKAYIESLKRDIKHLREERDRIERDRSVFRVEFLSLLKSNVSMCSKGEHYSAEFMVNRLSRLMNKVENWYW